MYRSIDDFLEDWKYESSMTGKVMDELTDASLAQPVADDHNTLGGLAWHVTVAMKIFLSQAGLSTEGPGRDAPQPATAAEIAAAYRAAAASVAQAVAGWTDEDLAGEISMFRYTWTRGRTLSFFVLHQAHHRGQMTVLMRQAGLKVPGVYGPSREERAAMLAAAPQPS